MVSIMKIEEEEQGDDYPTQQTRFLETVPRLPIAIAYPAIFFSNLKYVNQSLDNK